MKIGGSGGYLIQKTTFEVYYHLFLTRIVGFFQHWKKIYSWHLLFSIVQHDGIISQECSNVAFFGTFEPLIKTTLLSLLPSIEVETKVETFLLLCSI